MRPVRFTFGNFAAASANNIATTQGPLTAGSFVTINGTTAVTTVSTQSQVGATVNVTTAVLDTARQVIITSAGNDSGMTFTVTGTDFSGKTQTETFAGGSIGAAGSNLDYLTVTSIRANGATASTITVGTSTIARRIVPIDTYANPTNAQLNAIVTGTITFQIDQTLDDIWNTVPTNWFALQATGSATVQKTLSATCTAIRLNVTTFTAGAGSIFFEYVQAGGTTAA